MLPLISLSVAVLRCVNPTVAIPQHSVVAASVNTLKYCARLTGAAVTLDGKTAAERRRETLSIQATLPPDLKICSSCRQVLLQALSMCQSHSVLHVFSGVVIVGSPSLPSSVSTTRSLLQYKASISPMQIKSRDQYHACRAKKDQLQDRCVGHHGRHLTRLKVLLSQQTARSVLDHHSAVTVLAALCPHMQWCCCRCKACRASLDAVRTALARPANAAARPVGALALEVGQNCDCPHHGHTQTHHSAYSDTAEFA